MRCGAAGWQELDTADLAEADLIELWELVAQGDTQSAASIVAETLDVDDAAICDVDMVADPCELRIDWSCYRVWYKECAE